MRFITQLLFSRLISRSSFTLTLILTSLTFLTTCSPVKHPTIYSDIPLGAANGQVHVAFAGGGWRAHTGHSAWNIAMMAGGSRKLKDIYANTGVISSNSGGSWFSTMLMFSKDFVSDIESDKAVSQWGTREGGWLGHQEHIFNNTDGCSLLSGYAFDFCVFAEQTGSDVLHWHDIVEDVVYAKYTLGNSTLSAPRVKWAAEKELLLAGSLLTQEVQVSSQDEDYNFYQACLSPATPQRSGSGTATCSNGSPQMVSPITFYSMPAGKSDGDLPFLRANSGSPDFNLMYMDDGWTGDSKKETTIQNTLSTANTTIVAAAAASSAAVGFAAMQPVSHHWVYEYATYDMAPSFSLAGGAVNFRTTDDYSTDQLANEKIVKIADGGPVDNTGVAQLVSHLQSTGRGDNFEIVAFDNAAALTKVGNYGVMGGDFANLFGVGVCNGDQFCSGNDCGGVCINIPNPKIFEVRSLDVIPVWNPKMNGSDDMQLIYTPYNVTTVDNAEYNIKGGSTGIVHAFSCVWTSAATEPQNDEHDATFNQYKSMFTFINNNVREDTEGMKILKAVLRF